VRFEGIGYLALSTSAQASIAIGLSAAALFWTILWSIWLYRRTSRPRLKCRTAITITAAFTPDVRQYLSATAANTGAVPVTLEVVTLRVRGHNNTILPAWMAERPEPLSARLDAGAGHWTGYSDPNQLRHDLNEHYGQRDKWKVRAVFSIAGGKKFKSTSGFRRWKIFPSRWTTI
jgi:hypothetical protein